MAKRFALPVEKDMNELDGLLDPGSNNRRGNVLE